MTTQDLTLMSALLQKMDWTENRQKILSQNIANADTPGYQAQDIEPLDFKAILGSSASKLSLAAAGTGIETTNPMHISGSGATPASAGGDGSVSRHPYEVSPAGNAVILEEQLVKLNGNYTDHSFASNLYIRNMAMLKSALKSS